ncbi:hypothetical protein [Herbaspirillum sp. CAH-3]|uniref:hypothetical protein n=1 Tax=Herbaspirillum sp. CAH-3 TaxID=2605746 RepID=UPI0012ACF439|nr:hypothetical protein [Herbaspirillum sp. CAH-3]MRT30868.1 hypothetical protein [Herbaspirillum sp. CAH-3]
MIAATHTKTFIRCPHCDGDEFPVDHILNGTWKRSFGPWYCDTCGGSFRGTKDDVGQIDLELLDERKVQTLDLLVLQPQAKPVYFVLRGMRFEGPKFDGYPDNKEFFYEEHSCPTNWLRNIQTLIHDDDDDPHGLIEFVRSIESTPELLERDDMREAFPEAFSNDQKGGA